MSEIIQQKSDINPVDLYVVSDPTRAKVVSKFKKKAQEKEKNQSDTLSSKTILPELMRKSQLFQLLKKDNGNVDLLAVFLYWDIFRARSIAGQAKSRKSKQSSEQSRIHRIRTSYKELSQICGISKESLRRALVKLEKMGLIQRSYEHSKKDHYWNNLTVYMFKTTPYFTNRFGVEKKYCQITPYTNHQYTEETYGVKAVSQKGMPMELQEGGIHNQDPREHETTFSKEKDRSIKSISSSDLIDDEDSTHSNPRTIEDDSDNDQDPPLGGGDSAMAESNTNSKEKYSGEVKPESSFDSKGLYSKLSNFFKKQKPLQDFYPLNQGDCTKLQISSGREFSSNAINEILLSLVNKGSSAEFYSKKGFFAYMSKVLVHEMRDPRLISREGFKIKVNLTPEEQDYQVQEAFLEEIESSRQVSPEWHFKKKIASCLESSKAYGLLKSLKSITVEEGKARIDLFKPIALNDTDESIILSSIKASYEGQSRGIFYEQITELELVVTQPKQYARPLQSIGEPPKTYTGIWGRVRGYFASHAEESTRAIDTNWLSKLEPEVDDASKILSLKACNSFVRKYIEDNYLNQLQQAIAYSGFSLGGIRV